MAELVAAIRGRRRNKTRQVRARHTRHARALTDHSRIWTEPPIVGRCRRAHLRPGRRTYRRFSSSAGRPIQVTKLRNVVDYS